MGCSNGVKRFNSITLNFIDTRSNKMHTELVQKHDTADSKPDVFTTSSSLLRHVCAMEWKIHAICMHKMFNSLNYIQSFTYYWRTKDFMWCEFLNHTLQILIEQKQWQWANLVIFREKLFQVICVTRQLAYTISVMMHEMFFQIWSHLWRTLKTHVHLWGHLIASNCILTHA